MWFPIHEKAQHQMVQQMNPQENAISYSQIKPIIKPSHDGVLGLNKIEIIDRKLTEKEFYYAIKNIKINKKIEFANQTAEEIFNELGI